MGLCHSSTNDSKYFTTCKAQYQFLCIADMDKHSAEFDESSNQWSSFIQYGTLNRVGDRFRVKWESRDQVTSDVSDGKGRGMELSDAIILDGECFTFDDRTGAMFSFNPNDTKTFKSSDVALPKMKIEWCFQKGSKLYYGSHLDVHRKKTCTVVELDIETQTLTDSLLVQPFVKKLGEKIASDPDVPTYSSITVEAAAYSESREEMLIVPRALMYEKFDPATDNGAHGWNKFLKVKWNRNDGLQALNQITLDDIEIVTIDTPQILEKGFAAIDWIPTSVEENQDMVLAAVKSVEVCYDGVETIESYFSVFDLEGNVLLEDVRFPGNMKYEGLAFYDPQHCPPALTGAGSSLKSKLHE